MSEYREERDPRRRPRKSGTAQKGRLGMILGTILAIGFTTCLMFFGIFMIYVHTALEPELDVDASAYTLKQSSTVYYQNRTTGEWEELTKIHGLENRTLVDFEDIPDHVWQALVSIEDQRFFEHHGVDWKSTARSVFDMLRGSDSTRGGSTITQQVIKNLTGDNEVTIRRKVLEIFRALRFAENYSREEVLELYLNLVYFGNGASGIQAASEVYFGKDVGDLTVAEGAAIVGITQYPSLYDPSRRGTLNSGKTYREKNKDRQETVLYKMHELGYLDDAEYEEALNEKLVFVWDEDYVPTDREAEISAANTTYDSFFVEQVFNDVVLGNKEYVDIIANKDLYYQESYYMGLVGKDNALEFHDGPVRVVDQKGAEFDRYDAFDYLDHISEAVEPWSYEKFPYLKKVGYKGLYSGPDNGLYRATPLSRLNVCDKKNSRGTVDSSRISEYHARTENRSSTSHSQHTGQGSSR